MALASGTRWPAKVLLSAIELRLFSELGATSKTGDELQSALRLHPRSNPDFFDTLDHHSPQFMGGFLEMANARLYRFWGDLTEGLRTGSPQNEIKHTGTAMFAELYGT